MEQLFQWSSRITVNRLLNWFETWKSFKIVGNWKYLLLNTLYSPGSELLRNGSVSGGGEGGMVHPGLDTAAHIPPMFNNWGSVQVHYLHIIYILHTIYTLSNAVSTHYLHTIYTLSTHYLHSVSIWCSQQWCTGCRLRHLFPRRIHRWRTIWKHTGPHILNYIQQPATYPWASIRFLRLQ